MDIIKTPYVDPKYKEPGFYITQYFSIGDADGKGTSEYFIPEQNTQKLLEFAFMLDHYDPNEDYEDDPLDIIAPDFVWAYDFVCDEAIDDPYTEIMFWDGKQLYKCDIKYEPNEIPDDIKNLFNT